MLEDLKGVAIVAVQAILSADPDKSFPVLVNRRDGGVGQALSHREMTHLCRKIPGGTDRVSVLIIRRRASPANRCANRDG